MPADRVAVGIGAQSDVSLYELDWLVTEALTEAGLGPGDVAAIATVDRLAARGTLREFAERRGWPVVSYQTDVLMSVDVPTGSAVVERLTGAPSVAEAAALLAAGPGAELLLPKRRSESATVAIAVVR
jgi:cobalamin biosynthesis protein CbiG